MQGRIQHITVILFLLGFLAGSKAFAGNPPEADFSVDNTTPVVGQTIAFQDTSSGDPDSWKWNFGSGASPATSSENNPVNIIYSTSGLKTVTLKVSNDRGSNTKTKTNYINVGSCPNSWFYWQFTKHLFW